MEGGAGTLPQVPAATATATAAAAGADAAAPDDGRWQDAMHRALLGSLTPPPVARPAWWWRPLGDLQRRLADALESREAHYLVIGMVLLDLAIVLTELVLSSFYPTPELAPHLVHVLEGVLSRSSVGILALFASELAAKAAVFGPSYFAHKWHLFDAVVVAGSLGLELTLRGVAQEVASLLIFFRLWRILRIMHGLAEALELNHAAELQRLQAAHERMQAELVATQQQVLELQQQVTLLNTAAAAKGLDLHQILAAAAAQQAQLAAAAQQQLLASAAATASTGISLHHILANAAAQQEQAAAVAQQQLLAAAAAAAAAGSGATAVGSAMAAAAPDAACTDGLLHIKGEDGSLGD